MPGIGLLRTLVREMVTSERAPRVPEPDLVMDDQEQVADYVKAGRELGIMSPTYVFHCAQMCEVIRPGENVLDLACGPATQLGMLARLNPGTHFIGIDLSEEMLDRARLHIQDLGLTNVELQLGDITDLKGFGDESMDAVVSTMSLHHLPTLEHLDATFAEARRVLKPRGGLYLADFGHLKSEKSINYFAYQHEDRQPELFTLDYLNSLRAAFHREDFQRLTDRYFAADAKLISTFAFPFMVVVKGHARRESVEGLRQSLREIRASLAPPQQRDLKDLITFFKKGGLRAPLLA
jgi:ubiquinone/menaquinone biosynthesis C-methylase UbiE